MKNRKAFNSLIFFLWLIFCHQSNLLFGQNKDTTGHPPLGKMIDVGGYKLHIYQSGIRKNKEPAIILIHGLGSYSFDWYLVQQKVKSFSFVCSYDRAGQAWSETGTKPRGPAKAAKELNTLLNKAGIKPPYILVGQSWGGFVARTYTDLYPKEVVGIILVSSAHENEYLWINGRIIAPRLIPETEWNKITNKVMRDKDTTDLDKILYQIPKPQKLDSPYSQLPGNIQKIRMWAMSGPVTKRILGGGDINDFRADFSEVFQTTINKKYPVGNVPLIVLTEQKIFDPKNEDGYTKEQFEWNIHLQEQLTKLSSNSIQIITTKSGHHIQLDQPDLVVAAIKEMISTIKLKRKISNKKTKLFLSNLAK